MRKLMLTAAQWTELKFAVEMASIRASLAAAERENAAAKATGERKKVAARIAESYRKEAEMCERMEALVKSAEFVPETKEDKRNAETDSQRRRLV